METFLSQAAKKIVRLYPNDLQDVLVLLPSKRGELFLKRAISAHVQQPKLAPAMQTIEEFVQEASGYQKQSQLQLLITLYKVYKSNVKAEETFDGFLKWGNMLLHDFNEVDRHLVDAHQLFTNLLDAKTIENWGLEPGREATELMGNFLGFWKNLLPLYMAFQAELKKQNTSYQGKAYRKVADDLSLLDTQFAGKYSGIFLLGFNALNKAEEQIFQHLISQYNAVALWDADALYLNDWQHEAGEFLRAYKSKWPVFTKHPFEWVFENFKNEDKQIFIKSAPTKLGMSAAAGQILNTLPVEDQISTAVVLADEAMLLPMLDAVPSQYSAINVTMGLPLKHAPLAQDVLAILHLHEQAERSAAGTSNYAFHHSTFLAVIESALFKSVAGKIGREVVANLTARNSVFISPKNIESLFISLGFNHKDWLALFAKPTSALQLIGFIDAVVLAQAEVEESNPVQYQSAFALHQTHNQLQELLAPLNEQLENKTLLRLYQSILAEHQIDFYGEPLAGLQIMGMLETRTLDFKRVILTSLNEGILPAGKSQNSFIPYDLKRGFGLPTHQEKDAVYAYHFYRLLQRAEEIWLIYDSDMSGFGAKEKSRFILQVEHELAHLPKIKVHTETHYAPKVMSTSLLELPRFNKEGSVLTQLEKLAEKGFSPSALTVFLNDPSAFYIEKLLRVEDAEEIEESMGHDVLGKVVHDTLDALYKPFCKKVLLAEQVREKQKEVPQEVLTQISKHYQGNTNVGHNLLVKNVVLHMVEQVLKEDIKRIERLKNKNQRLTIELLEEVLHTTCSVPGISFKVNFKGIADRIERVGDTVYILDYKTGTIGDSDMSCPNGVVQMFEPGKKNKAFQVMFYAWLYVKNYGFPAGGLSAGLFSTRRPSLGFTKLAQGKNRNITEEQISEFETELFNLVQELFDETKPFTQRLVNLEETETA